MVSQTKFFWLSIEFNAKINYYLEPAPFNISNFNKFFIFVGFHIKMLQSADSCQINILRIYKFYKFRWSEISLKDNNILISTLPLMIFRRSFYALILLPIFHSDKHIAFTSQTGIPFLQFTLCFHFQLFLIQIVLMHPNHNNISTFY